MTSTANAEAVAPARSEKRSAERKQPAENRAGRQWEVRYSPLNVAIALRKISTIEQNPYRRELHLRLADDPAVPLAREIKPFAQFVAEHPLGRLMRGDPSPQFYERCLRQPKFLLRGFGECIPASPESTHPDPRKDYHTHEWGRDLSYSLLALKWLGEYDRMRHAARGIFQFYGSPEHLGLITHFHFLENQPHLSFAETRAALPFIRVPIAGNGKLAMRVDRTTGIDDGHVWGHDQPCSFGDLLWGTFRLANDGLLDLAKMNAQIARYHERGNGQQSALRQEAIYVSLAKMLHRICICDPGSGRRQFYLWTKGPWEEEKAVNRLSEIVPIYAAALEMHRFFRKFGWKELKINDGGGGPAGSFRDNLEELVQLADEALQTRLPRRSTAPAREADADGHRVKPYDSAIACALWPYDLDLTREQEIAVLKTLYSLMKRDNYSGPGVIRYEGDPYCGSLLSSHADSNWNVTREQPRFKEQQWFLTDPTIALWASRRASRLFQDGNDPDKAFVYYQYARAHALRANSQLPMQEDSYTIHPTDGGAAHTVRVTPGIFREGSWQDGEGRWRMGPNTLNWSAALSTTMNIRMIHVSRQAREARERALVRRNGRTRP